MLFRSGDAEAVAALLEEKYGFRVTKLINATRLDITGAFNRLRQTLTEKDNLSERGQCLKGVSTLFSRFSH